MSGKILSFLVLLLIVVVLPSRAQTHEGTAQPGREAAKEADTAFRAGYAAFSKNNLAEARADFQKVVELAPRIPEGHSALGAVLLRMNDYPEAISELKTTLRLKPNDVVAETNLALVYAGSGANADAVALFTKLEKQAAGGGQGLPTNVLQAYARSLVAIHQPARAVETMKQAVAMASQDAVLHDELGSLYAQQTKWPQARSEFEDALRLNPQLAVAHLHLGIALENQQEAAASMRELTTAAQLAPESALAQLTFGKALFRAGDDEAAEHALEKAMALGGGNDAKYQLALVYQARGKYKQSLPLFEDVAKVEPDNAPLLTNLALDMVQLGNSKGAIPLFKRAIAATPAVVTIHEDLGVAYLQENDIDDSITEFHAGLKLMPSDPQLHYNMGLALKLKDDLNAAIVELETSAKLDPSAPDPPFTLGILYMQQGRFDESARQLQKALEIHPQNGDGWAVLGSVYRQENKLPEAVSALKEAIRLAPNQPGPHITLGGVLSEEGKPTEAAAERKIAADLTRVAVNRQRATFATNTGNMMLQKGQTADAIARYQEAIVSDSSYAEAHRELSIALAREGRTAEADLERKKAEDIANAAEPDQSPR